MKAERLRKEQALRVEELQEINRKKLGGATLTERELREDLSDSQPNLEETLSQVSISSKADKTARVNDWVNNSPVVNASVPTNTVAVTRPVQEPVGLLVTITSPIVIPMTGIANVHTVSATALASNSQLAIQLRDYIVPRLTMATTHSPVIPPLTSTQTTNVTAPPSYQP